MAGNGRRNADQRLALGIAAGTTFREAALAAGLSERTVHRRMADSEFRRRVYELRAAMVDRATGQMAHSVVAAAETLRSLLAARAEVVRLGAARSLIDLAVRLREHIDFEQRLQALEQRLANNERAGNHDRATET
jgi:hypothetical protein